MKTCEENGRAVADHFVRSYKAITGGATLCDDCAVTSGNTGLRAYLVPGTRYCPGEYAEKEVGFDNL